MRLYLCSKKVLRFQGDARAFLNAYTTNTPDKVKTAFLDRAGRIVAVGDQVLLSHAEALVVIESKFVDRLLLHLGLYLRLSGIQVKAEESLNVYFDLEGDYRPAQDERGILQKKGQLVLTEKGLVPTVTEEEFTRFRLQINLPLQGIDFDEEMLLNVADEEYVSYTKGCYLGQEIIARVHHRSKPPKKLVVRSEEECTLEERSRMTSKLRPMEGPTVGFVFI